jgi:hypothetical protein
MFAGCMPKNFSKTLDAVFSLAADVVEKEESG